LDISKDLPNILTKSEIINKNALKINTNINNSIINFIKDKSSSCKN